MMNYEETLDYLFRRLPMFQRTGPKAFKKDLNNIIALCAALDNPERKFKSVHVAGTNGKGSVSNLLSAILQSAGYKTGLYTSPHLRSFTERIRINGTEIPEPEVVNFVQRTQDIIEEIQPSFFEVTVAMAFDHFARQEVDIAVIEVGLGGRLDSTNVITPGLSIITNISFDHQAFLGNTLELIAGEKAGIIKPGVPVLIGERQLETTPVFVEKAGKALAKLFFADEFLEVESVEIGLDHSKIKVSEKNRSPVTIKVGLPGKFQLKNARTAIAAARLLQAGDWNIQEKDIEDGIGNVKKLTGFRGRMETLSTNPLVLTDVGHNEAGVNEIMAAIAGIDHRQLHLVWGMVNDKDTEKILRMLPKNAVFYFVKPDVPRGLATSELQRRAAELGLEGPTFPSVNAGLEVAKRNAGEKDLIFVGGSTFVVAEVV